MSISSFFLHKFLTRIFFQLTSYTFDYLFTFQPYLSEVGGSGKKNLCQPTRSRQCTSHKVEAVPRRPPIQQKNPRRPWFHKDAAASNKVGAEVQQVQGGACATPGVHQDVYQHCGRVQDAHRSIKMPQCVTSWC